jgi:uncharacterized protein
MIRFNADKSLITAQRGDEGDEEYARIAGIAVPWGVVATVSDGQKVRFERGAFDVDQKAAKLIQNHDLGQLLGIVDNLDDADAGLEFEAVLADTAAGRDAVALIKAGAYDAVSVGANPVKFTTDPEGVMSVTEAQLIELSLVSIRRLRRGRHHRNRRRSPCRCRRAGSSRIPKITQTTPSRRIQKCPRPRLRPSPSRPRPLPRLTRLCTPRSLSFPRLWNTSPP